MDYILNIHTTTETAIVNICNGKEVIATKFNNESKEHAKFLHTAIQKLLQENNIEMNALKAIGVTNGPGSYTGIRVGLSTAKGLCFSLKIPMITFNALEVMALSAFENIQDQNAFYWPMTDARRMEVFTAIYRSDITEIIPPSAIILEENTFKEIKAAHTIYCFGSGSKKFENILIKNSGFQFINQDVTSEALCRTSYAKYQQKMFDNVAFAEPLYIKDFHSTTKK